MGGVLCNGLAGGVQRRSEIHPRCSSKYSRPASSSSLSWGMLNAEVAVGSGALGITVLHTPS